MNVFKGKALAYVTCFAGLLLGIDNGGLQFVLLKIAYEFDMSETVMGSLVTIQFAALTIAALVAGFTADIIGKKKIACLAALVFAISSVVCYLKLSAVAVAIGIFGCGASFGALEVSVCAALSDAYSDKSGRYLLIMQGMLGLGSVLGPFATNYAMKTWNAEWNILFLFCATLFFVALICLIFTEFRTVEVLHESGSLEGKLNIKGKFALGLIVCALLYGGMETGIGSFVDAFFVTQIGAPQYSALTLSMFWAAIGVVRLLAGILYKYRKAILLLAYGASGVLYIALSMVESPSSSILVTICIGLSIGAVLPTLVSLANESYPRSTGKMTSFINAASGIGSSVSPPLIGAAAGSIGLGNALACLGIAALTGLAVYVFLVYKKLRSL